MVADFLRSCHFRQAYLVAEDSTPFLVRWYRAAPGAKPFPHLSAFGSPVWDSGNAPDPVGPRMLEPIVEWAPNAYPAPAGTGFTGRAEWFLDGLPSSQLQPLPVPTQCGLAVMDARGGPRLGGAGRMVIAPIVGEGIGDGGTSAPVAGRGVEDEGAGAPVAGRGLEVGGVAVPLVGSGVGVAGSSPVVSGRGVSVGSGATPLSVPVAGRGVSVGSGASSSAVPVAGEGIAVDGLAALVVGGGTADDGSAVPVAGEGIAVDGLAALVAGSGVAVDGEGGPPEGPPSPGVDCDHAGTLALGTTYTLSVNAMETQWWRFAVSNGTTYRCQYSYISGDTFIGATLKKGSCPTPEFVGALPLAGCASFTADYDGYAYVQVLGGFFGSTSYTLTPGTGSCP